jgi:protein ImuB
MARPAGTPRIACLLVPDLPRAAALRAHPELAGHPFVVCAGTGARAEIASASEEAIRCGVRRGHRVAEAHALCAELAVHIASPALEETTRAALLDAALSCSPRAELEPRRAGAFTSEAAVCADASGVAALFCGEAGFATALAQRAAALGLSARVAVAGSRSVARVAARRLAGDGETCVLAAGREADFLAPLPLDVLDPDDALAERLTRFGVHTVRDLLRLPREALATRLGPAATALALLARGHCPLPAPCAPADARIAEAIDLEYPAERLETLLFALQALLSRLLARLEVRHLACDELGLALDLTGGGRDIRRIGVSAPTRELRVLVRLVAQSLETQPPRGAVLCARLETRGRALAGSQLDLFRPPGPAPGALAPALAELASWCGAARIGAPAVADANHPDAQALAEFAPTARYVAPPAHSGSFSLALRMLRPAAAAEVRLRAGHPTSIRSAVCSGRVLRCAGPWRTTGGWWSREGRFAFDHYDVQTEDGTVVRLRYDHVARSWQIDGIYD